MRRNCACVSRAVLTPRFVREQGRSVPVRARSGLVRVRAPIPKTLLRETPTLVRDRVEPQAPRSVTPILIRKESKCRPFLTVQKDAERFAACNALADEIGVLDAPKKVFKILQEAIGDEVNEVFGVITLDIHKRFKGMAETGRGEPASVMAPIMPTLQAAVMDGADSAIIFHVHPSGVEAEPSDADIETTNAFVDAFDVIGIPLLDHVIVGGDIKNRSYYSFLEDNAL
jgi:hypothetical protein